MLTGIVVSIFLKRGCLRSRNKRENGLLRTAEGTSIHKIKYGTERNLATEQCRIEMPESQPSIEIQV